MALERKFVVKSLCLGFPATTAKCVSTNKWRMFPERSSQIPRAAMWLHLYSLMTFRSQPQIQDMEERAPSLFLLCGQERHKQKKFHRIFSRSYIWMSMYLGHNLPRNPTFSLSSLSTAPVGYWSWAIKKDAVMTEGKFDISYFGLGTWPWLMRFVCISWTNTHCELMVHKHLNHAFHQILQSNL